jgi:uncharacterized tellurite resistance protein B-like protein
VHAVDESQKRKLCQLIAGIVVADDDLDPTESAFIDRMLARFGIDPAERDIIFPIVDTDEAVRAVGAMPADVQTETLDLLVQAATADGKVVPAERDYLKAVVKAMGRDERELARLVAKHLKEPVA